jgi:hypothetical protein
MPQQTLARRHAAGRPGRCDPHVLQLFVSADVQARAPQLSHYVQGAHEVRVQTLTINWRRHYFSGVYLKTSPGDQHVLPATDVNVRPNSLRS